MAEIPVCAKTRVHANGFRVRTVRFYFSLLICVLVIANYGKEIRAEPFLREPSGTSAASDIFMRDEVGRSRSVIISQAGNTSYIAPHDSVYERAQHDLTTFGRKTTTSDFWITVMQISGISLVSAMADKPMDKFAASHGTSGMMSTVRNIGNALPLVAVGYSSVAFFTSDQDSLSSRTAYDALAAGGLGFASALGMKYMVGRARPDAEKGSASFTPMNAGNGDTSWPSIHTTVIWSMITPYAKAYDASWLYGVAAVTNAARVAGRDHWFSDTVAGALFGYAIGDYMWSSHQTKQHKVQWAISPNNIAFSWKF